MNGKQIDKVRQAIEMVYQAELDLQDLTCDYERVMSIRRKRYALEEELKKLEEKDGKEEKQNLAPRKREKGVFHTNVTLESREPRRMHQTMRDEDLRNLVMKATDLLILDSRRR